MSEIIEACQGFQDLASQLLYKLFFIQRARQQPGALRLQSVFNNRAVTELLVRSAPGVM
jgi:hypothetical protein